MRAVAPVVTRAHPGSDRGLPLLGSGARVPATDVGVGKRVCEGRTVIVAERAEDRVRITHGCARELGWSVEAAQQWLDHQQARILWPQVEEFLDRKKAHDLIEASGRF